jgi:magnesium chelatase family protein
MMLSRLLSASLRGLDAEAVDVEVDLSRGLPSWNMVGLPEAAVREARDRVRAALLNSGFEFPLRHITVNLAPADRRKDGSHFDLPVAVGMLLASGQLAVPEEAASFPLLVGELALDGRINAVAGVLPLALFARQRGLDSIIVPADNAAEASAVEGLTVYAANHLLDVVRHLSGRDAIPRFISSTEDHGIQDRLPDLADIRGQHQARRALEIAAAGGHHLLLIGSPGVGKSMLASRLPGILPPLTSAQRLEVARIYSVAGEGGRSPLSSAPPFRAPHHSASDVAIIGGGSIPRPGEISKATHGVLFLDELAEHKRQVLDMLRQPLEEGYVCIARAADTVVFPARFQLVAAMNPCVCGYLGHPTRSCRCSASQIRQYTRRISGPLLDRFDLRVHVPPVEHEELSRMQPGEASASVAERVRMARQRQYTRLGEGRINAHMDSRKVEQYSRPDAEGLKLLEAAMRRFSLSARSYHRILKVARTIADLEGRRDIGSDQIAEALQYRGDEGQD